MDSNRKTAIIVGVLFIIVSASPITSALFIGPVFDSNYLTTIAANETQLLIGVLPLLVMTAAIVSGP